jgi:osmoprotectant transport system permease protein
MNYFTEAFAWIGENLYGPNGVLARTVEHLIYTVLAVLLASLVAIPLGYLVGHTRRGRGLVVASSGAARALPSLGVVTLFALVFGIGLFAPMIALVLLAIPSVLAGAYAGIEAIDHRTVDAARAMGMAEWQILARVEMPLGLPLLLGGLRSATLQVVATATLAAYVGAGGLGRFLILGLKTQDYPQMLASALLVVALALIMEGPFEIAEPVAARRLHTN